MTRALVGLGVTLATMTTAPTAAPARPAAGARVMIPCTVIRVGAIQGKYVVLLAATKGNRLLPIWVGRREAQAIQLGLSKLTPPRPLTHNLLANTIRQLRASVVRVEIIALVKRVFIGQLVLRDKSGTVQTIDARPSDSIALAVLRGRPILVEASVLRRAGVARPRTLPPAAPAPTPPRPSKDTSI